MWLALSSHLRIIALAGLLLMALRLRAQLAVYTAEWKELMMQLEEQAALSQASKNGSAHQRWETWASARLSSPEAPA